MSSPQWRMSRVEVDLAILEENARILTALFAPADFCAVVKADGYGHGSVKSAKAALRGGATYLAVALVEEGIALRGADISAPILVLSEPPQAAMNAVVQAGLTPAIYTLGGLSALAEAASTAGKTGYPLHVKVDTGMHRVGASPIEVSTLLEAAQDATALQTEGLFTHFAVADDPSSEFTGIQAQIFDAMAAELEAADLLPPIIHLANSAGGLTRPDLRRSLVRAGIAFYGIQPSESVKVPVGVKPAMSVKAEVSFTKRVAAHERLSYGLRYELPRDSTIATVPLGYADGLPRSLGAHGGEVLIRGNRYPVAGTVTMDQILVDCGDDPVAIGDEVVVFGVQGTEEILAEEIGQRTETIGYEIVCRMGPRLPRRYVNSLEDSQ